MMSDGEHSIVALKEQAARGAGVENVPQESPVGDRRSNGLAEFAVREVKRQVRVLRGTNSGCWSSNGSTTGLSR